MIELSGIVVILVVLGLLLGIITALIAWKRKKEGKYKETDHRAFFTMGISFLPLGIVMSITIGNPGMLGITAIGIVYMIMGLANRDKWKKK